MTTNDKNYKDDITKRIIKSRRYDLKPKEYVGRWVTPSYIVRETSPHINEIELLHEIQIARVNTNNLQKIKNIYHYLGSYELLTIAHNTIYKNKGAATKGTSDQTVDGISDEHLLNISNLIKNKEFQWSPIRKVEIPRPNKKPRPLGISNYTDKLVQFICTLILNAIYDPIFNQHNYNHGFRPHHSTHDNIIQLTKYQNQGLNMAIEGDISGAFDHVNHSKLIGILKKNIDDEDFLNIIESACKNNIIKFNELNQIKETITPIMGTPQGYIVSPILFNIYMFDFDIYINKTLESKFKEINKQRNNPLKPNPEYHLIDKKIRRARYAIKKLNEKKISRLLNEEEKMILITNKKRLIYYSNKIRKLPSRDPNQIKLRYQYSRYADDFIIICNASEEICNEIKEICMTYLKERLDLDLNVDKTKITNLKKDSAQFLGFSIYMSNLNSKITNTSINNKALTINRRGGSTIIKAGIDFNKRNKQLIEKGYAKMKNNKLFPSRAKYLVTFSAIEIIEHYTQVMDGICNYYFRIINNKSQLNSILYYLQYSCLFTLASKYKTSIAKIYSDKSWTEVDIKSRPTGRKRIVFTETMEFPDTKGNTIRSIVIPEYKDCLSKALRIAHNCDAKLTNPEYLTQENYWKLIKVNWRTSTQLPKICIICGTTVNIEVHHTNALRKGTTKKSKKREPFQKFMSSINRKMIPLCKEHHYLIHQGTYDDINLKTIYDERLPRISNFLLTNTSSYYNESENIKRKYYIPPQQYTYNNNLNIIQNPYINNDFKKRPRYKPNFDTDIDKPTQMQLFIKKYFNVEKKPTDKDNIKE